MLSGCGLKGQAAGDADEEGQAQPVVGAEGAKAAFALALADEAVVPGDLGEGGGQCGAGDGRGGCAPQGCTYSDRKSVV